MKSISLFIDNSGILLTKKALAGGIKKDAFYRFIAKHNFEKIAYGIYLAPTAWEDSAFVLHQRFPQAILSHDEALFHYNLIDREPLQPTITVYSGYNTQKLKNYGVKVFSIKKELLLVGKTQYQNSFGHQIPIYNLERTICDLVRNRSSFESQDIYTALKNYVINPDKDLNQLMTYAPLFRIEKQIRQYLEVLL